MFASKPIVRKLGYSAALLLMSGLAWAGDVTVYDRAPSVDELQQKLTGGEGKKKLKTRSIVFGDAAQEAAPAAPAAEAKPQAAPVQPAVYAPAAPVAVKAQPAQTMQVSDNAIAFPINFRVNSSDILPESVPFLESIVGLMQKDPSIRLLVEGHTDSSGSAARNTALSRERAYSVVNYLIDRYRIDPTRLMPVGKGFSEPLSGMEPTNPKNRRVQFRIIG